MEKECSQGMKRGHKSKQFIADIITPVSQNSFVVARWSQIKTCFNAYCLVSVVRQPITRVIAVCFIFKNFVNPMTCYKFEEFFIVFDDALECGRMALSKRFTVLSPVDEVSIWETASQTCFIHLVKSYCATSLWILAECNIAVNIYMPTVLYARRGAQLKPVISWDLFSDGGFSKIISIDFFEGPKTLNSAALKYNVALNRKSTQTYCCLKVNNINIKFCRKTYKT